MSGVGAKKGLPGRVLGVVGRRRGRFGRWIVVTTAFSLLLSIGAQVDPAYAGPRFPLPDIAAWLPTSGLGAPHGAPVQRSARGLAGEGRDVPASATRAGGGAGRPPGQGKGALPAAKPALYSTTPTTTNSSPDRGYDPATSVRLPASSTSGSDLFNNADGSQTRRIWGGPRNYRDVDGVWKPIDPALILRADRRLHNRSHNLDVSVAARGSQTPDLASMRLPTGEEVSYGLVGAAGAPALVDGATATYVGILPGTDLELTTFASGLKETLVLRSASAPTSWLFPLRLRGLSARIESDGSIALINTAGLAVAWFPQGVMEDSFVDPESGAPASSSAITYELVTMPAGQQALRVTADQAWLRDPARVYPIRVDPTTTTGTTGDVYVDSDASTTNHNGNDLPVGTFNSGTVVARSFIHLDDFDNNGLMGKRIAKATLNLYHTWSYDCNTHLPFYVHKVTSQWTVAGLTNNAGLSAGPSYTSAIGSLTVANNYPACTNTSAVRSVGAWVQVPLNVGTFNDWSINGGNFGLALTATETNSYGWKRFTSANYSSGTYKPYLDVEYYDNVAPQLDGLYPDYGQAVSTLRPELLVSAHDPDGFPKSLKYDFQVYDATGTTLIARSNWVTSRTWTVPANVLTWGQTYTWTVVVNDGLNNSVDTTKYLMRTPVPQPVVTSSLSQNGGQGFEAAVGNYTTSATDAAVASVGPIVSILRSYNSLDPRTQSAFGAGWSTLLDAGATETRDPATGAVQTVVVRYPTGQEVAFGKNSDGSFSPPQGRVATFTAEPGGGYRLVDRDKTNYVFTNVTSVVGQFGLTLQTDVQGRALTITYDGSNRVGRIASTSGRGLNISWARPPGAAADHVVSVATDPEIPGNSTTANTWTYGYAADSLTSVCPPTSVTFCTTYQYTTRSLYRNAVINVGADTYLRLNDSGSVAASSIVDNVGLDNGAYAGVTLGQPGPLVGSTSTAAAFNGTSSYVVLPRSPFVSGTSQTVSVWFKTAGGSGVLLGQSWDDAASSSTTNGAYAPILYVGADGKLVGQFPTAPATGALGSLLGYGSGRCLEVAGNSSANGTKVQLWDCNGGAHQQWTLTAASELRVTAGGVVKCLRPASGSAAEGTDLQTWSCDNSLAQKWTLHPDGQIVNQGSNRCIDADRDGTANGTVAQIYTCFGARRANQAWFSSTHAPMQTATSVADNQWHHAVVTVAGSTQSLYLDGAQVAQLTNVIPEDINLRHVRVGVGYLGGGWPNQPNSIATSNRGTRDYFAGSVGELSFHDRPLTTDEVAQLFGANHGAALLSAVVRPSGGVHAAVSYDPVTSVVTQVTDDNGGVWTPQTPVIAGTSRLYAAQVLAAMPSDYYRMNESGTVDAVNQVQGETATYSSGVSLGTSAGPFNDGKAATFNGTSTYLRLPARSIPAPGTISVSMWFRTTSAAGGTLFGYQTNPVTGTSSASGNWMPALYVGTDGKLRGKLCWCGGNPGPITSAQSVRDGNWHHVALVGSSSQTLYLDGLAVGTLNSGIEATTAAYAYIGAGETNAWPARPTNSKGYFAGDIAEVAFYASALPAQRIVDQYNARVGANAEPGKTLSVIDPANKTIAYVYDLTNGQKIADIDTRGYKTRYTYDTRGFLYEITDPNGYYTRMGHDVRGNMVSKSNCQNQATAKCSTVYYTHFPDAVTQFLTPDPRNDKVLTQRGAGSAGPDDNTYLTSYTYDPSTGDVTQVVDELGRTTRLTYTTAQTPAVGGGLTVPGQLATVVKPGGARQTMQYYASGDLAISTDAVGKVTSFTYDWLGRVGSQTEYTDSYPTGLTTTYQYDGQDRVVVKTDPPVTNRVTGAVHTATTTTAYTHDGQVDWQTVSDSPAGGDASRTVHYGYDTRARLSSQTDELNRVTQYTYDAYGHVETVTYPDQNVVKTTFDGEGNELKVELLNWVDNPNDPQAPTTLPINVMAYDPAGRLASVTDAEGWLTEYTYTDNGLLASVTRRDPAPGGESYVYEANEYDDAGNRTAQVTNNGLTRVEYTFDHAGRSLSATLDPTVPPAAGLNRTTAFQYSAADDVVVQTVSDSSGTIGRTESMYDPLGRVIARTRYVNGQLTPAARWRLNETSGAVAADSSGNSAATVSGSATWSADNGGSVSLSGAGALTTTGPVVDSAGSFSVAGWVYLADGSRNQAVFAQEGKQSSGFYLKFDHYLGNYWNFTMESDDTNAATNSSYVLAPASGAVNAWTHLAAVFDASTRQMRLYVNGLPAGTSPVPANADLWTAQGAFAIGRLKWHGFLGDYWDGRIKDVQAYGRALSSAEVSDIHGNTAPATSAAVIRTSAHVDQDGRITSLTDGRGYTTNIVNDELGRPVVTTSPQITVVEGESSPTSAVATTWIGYNTFGEVTELTDPNGKTTIQRYDAVGQLVETELPAYTPPGSATPIVAKALRHYNDAGQVDSVTDALNHTTSYLYDQLGRVVRVTAADLAQSRYTYDLLGNQQSETDPTGAITRATVDFLGRTLTSTEEVSQDGPQGVYVTRYHFNPGDTWPAWVDSATNVRTRYTYNAAGELLTSKDAFNNTTSFGYDGVGRQTRQTLPDNTYSTVDYDWAGRPLSKKDYDAGGQLLRGTSRLYDVVGNVVSTTDALGHSTTFAYDPLGRLISQVEPVSPSESITSSFGYDLAGNRTRFVDGRGNAFATTYNEWGLPASQIEPATAAHPAVADRTVTFSYDAGGRLAHMAAPGGVTNDYSYDPLDRLLHVSGSGAEAATVSRDFGYDSAGRMTSFSGPGGVNTVSYDDRSLVRQVSGPMGSSTFSYYGDRKLRNRVDAAGTTDFSYDAAGRLWTVDNGGAGVDMTYSYTTASQVQQISYGPGANKRVFGYDSLHRLQSDDLQTGAGSSIAKIEYGWDNNENLLTRTTSGFVGAASNSYEYDFANRLTQWDDGTNLVLYAYDKSGNRVQAGTTAYTYDERNRPASAGSTTYEYTARGSLRRATSPSGVVETAADAFGQVISQQATGATGSTYSYDALGRAFQAGFAYSGLGNTLAGDGTTQYVRGPAGDVLAAADAASQRAVWTDVHTDVVGQFTASSGALTGSTRYEPWGKVVATTAMIGRLGYQSELADAVTGRINMWSRWYNPESGQFDGRDSADVPADGTSVKANRYAYADDSPLVNTDPTGHMVGDRLDLGSACDDECQLNMAYRELDQAEQMLEQANRDSRMNLWTVLRDVGIGMLLDMIGYNDAVDCFGKGDVWACVSLFSSILPVGKVVQLGRKLFKMIDRAMTGYRTWKRIVDGARALYKRGGDLLNRARKDIDNLQRKIGKKPKAGKKPPTTKKPDKPTNAKRPGQKPKAGKPASATRPNHAPKRADKPKAKSPDGKGEPGKGKGADDPAGRRADEPAQPEPKTCTSADAAAPRHSFDPATRVVMADGSSKAIAEIAVGDRVVATDPATGETSSQPVTMLHLNRDTDLTDVTVVVTDAPAAALPVGVRDGGGSGTTRGPTGSELVEVPGLHDVTPAALHTTSHHPFWNETTQEWTNAADLRPGDRLRTDGGAVAVVAAVDNHTGRRAMRDLTVDRIHTYYVVAGNTPVLVHNCNVDNASIDDLHGLATNGGNPRTLSPAGRSIQKHADPSRSQAQRDKYDYGATTTQDRNFVGQTLIEEILTDPRAARWINHNASAHYGGSTLDVLLKNGLGARWSMRGGSLTFEGFL